MYSNRKAIAYAVAYVLGLAAWIFGALAMMAGGHHVLGAILVMGALWMSEPWERDKYDVTVKGSGNRVEIRSAGKGAVEWTIGGRVPALEAQPESEDEHV